MIRLLRDPVAGARIQHRLIVKWPVLLIPAAVRDRVRNALIPNAQRFWDAVDSDLNTGQTSSRFSSKCNRCTVDRCYVDASDAVALLLFSLANRGQQHCSCFPQLGRMTCKIERVLRTVVDAVSHYRERYNLSPLSLDAVFHRIAMPAARRNEDEELQHWVVMLWNAFCTS